MSTEDLKDKLKESMRRDAIEWWDTLDSISKLKWTTHYYTQRSPSSLTGREIEIMYRDVHRLPKLRE